MKRNRLLLILVVALALGALAGYLALNFLSTQASPLVAAEAKPTGRIVVATRDIPVGDVLRNEDVKQIDYPTDVVPQGFAQTPAQVVGRGVITPLRLNEPVLSTKLADKEAGGGLPIVIPEGMRAVSVAVNEVIAIAGYVTPFTRVDVLLSVKPPGEGDVQTITKTILQNIPVLSAGQIIQRNEKGEPITAGLVTLLVTPEQAEELTLAAGEGRIQLALRNTLDVTDSNTKGVQLADVIGTGRRSSGTTTRAVRVAPTRRAPSTPAAQTQGTVVETYRGGVRTLSTFQQ